MNKKKPSPKKVNDWLIEATKTLEASEISSPRLDALIIMEYVLGIDRGHLIAHPFRALQPSEQKELEDLLVKRAVHYPIAYILGQKEFYGRRFCVDENVMIPRPETEKMIDEIRLLKPASILDVGTGSGIIAITCALELPEVKITAIDKSSAALEVAKNNALKQGAKIAFMESDLLEKVEGKFDVIAANLPYGTKKKWVGAKEQLKHEPEMALYSDEKDGLDLYRKLFEAAPNHLSPSGSLICEFESDQLDSVKKIAALSKLPNVSEYSPFIYKFSS